jgi:uncharacterized protein YggU (UPF0235/DUF167 family)
VAIGWDPWRTRWTVAVPERAERGAANRAILAAVAGQLGVPVEDVRWRRAGTSAAKELEVTGLDASQVERRLRAAAGPGGATAQP